MGVNFSCDICDGAVRTSYRRMKTHRIWATPGTPDKFESSLSFDVVCTECFAKIAKAVGVAL